MNIVITEGHALNPGDLSYDVFASLGSLVVRERTQQKDLISCIKDTDAVIVNKVQITKEVIGSCPRLKYVGVMATGYNTIDIEECKKKGITVTNIPSYSTSAVCQHVFSLLLEFTNRVGVHSASVFSGEWQNSKDFCYWKTPLIELQDKTFGVFGLGSIGTAVANVARAFGMEVIASTRTQKPQIKSVSKYVTLKELFILSDIISLHAPLNQETQNIISKKYLDIAKQNLILINTARGGLVQESDVASALEQSKIAGYLADVAQTEPILATNPLLKAPNCILTPHLAWSPLETRKRCLDIAFSNLRAWIQGQKQNVIT